MLFKCLSLAAVVCGPSVLGAQKILTPPDASADFGGCTRYITLFTSWTTRWDGSRIEGISYYSPYWRPYRCTVDDLDPNERTYAATRLDDEAATARRAFYRLLNAIDPNILAYHPHVKQYDCPHDEGLATRAYGEPPWLCIDIRTNSSEVTVFFTQLPAFANETKPIAGASSAHSRDCAAINAALTKAGWSIDAICMLGSRGSAEGQEPAASDPANQRNKMDLAGVELVLRELLKEEADSGSSFLRQDRALEKSYNDCEKLRGTTRESMERLNTCNETARGLVNRCVNEHQAATRLG